MDLFWNHTVSSTDRSSSGGDTISSNKAPLRFLSKDDDGDEKKTNCAGFNVSHVQRYKRNVYMAIIQRYT